MDATNDRDKDKHQLIVLFASSMVKKTLITKKTVSFKTVFYSSSQGIIIYTIH
ncbi:hypothetical protein SAMN04489724_3107 [Algoriphagus locisalis]|uniref:Uncharacterized protein n=1 Tax=Algoriphagus locisalis TaxID=305507 RepID=A0A1I7CE58_9BACT|nr:hypothetical protein SAMN04489724_3107 [Algoriphagus locisalis]